VRRASDRDRNRSATLLATSYARGELSTQTFEWRLDRVLGARTREQLRHLTGDLAGPVLERVRGWLAPGTIPAQPVAVAVDLRLGELTGSHAVVGRAPLCQVCLPHDDAASRCHAVLRRYDDGWVVEDLDSTNGVWLNGRRVDRARLSAGDLVTCGETLLRIRP
jgi:hypothetical protein